MSYKPTVPVDLQPLVDVVAERLNSRLTRQHISSGIVPHAIQIEANKKALAQFAGEAIEAIIDQGFEIKRKEEDYTDEETCP